MNLICYIAAILCIALTLFSIKEAKDTARKQCRMEKDAKYRPKYGRTVVLSVCAFACIIAANSFRIIPTGHTGVRATFGIIDKESCPSGFNWTIPFVQHITLVNNKQQDKMYGEDSKNAAWSETNDETVMYMQGINVTYQIMPDASAWIYSNVDNWDHELITQDLVFSAAKAASRKQDTDKVMDRAIIEPAVQEELQKSMDAKYGTDKIRICKITIAQMDFEDSYNEAIAKRSAAMQAQKEQAILNQTEIEKAEAEVQKARAEADAMRERAQGEADAELIKAEGKAKANAKVNGSITEKTQKQDAIEKWDGQLPRYTGSENISFGILDSAADTE